MLWETAFRVAAEGVRLFDALPGSRGGWRLRRLLQRALGRRNVRFQVRRLDLQWELELEDDANADWSLLFDLGHEPTSTEWVRRRVRPGDVCLDVGANLGYFTCLMAARCGPQGRVFAFEPSSHFFRRLSRHVELNRFSNVETFNLGLSDSASTLTLHVTAATASIAPQHWAPSEGRPESITLIRLDDWAKEHALERLDLVKVDTDGHELAFLTGAEQTLTRLRPDLMMEICPEALAGGRAEALVLLERVSGLGYRLFSEDGERRFESPAAALDGLLANGVAGANVVCRSTRT